MSPKLILYKNALNSSKNAKHNLSLLHDHLAVMRVKTMVARIIGLCSFSNPVLEIAWI